MTREIKFREWTRGKYRSWEELGAFHMRVLNDGKGVFEQFTGFVAANGYEIYEGDVLFDTDNNWVLGVVEMFDGQWFCDGNLLIDCLGCDVIGNVHENPELLEE